jgi:hypothetical protein
MALVGVWHTNDKPRALRLQCRVFELANGVVGGQKDVVLHPLQQGMLIATSTGAPTLPSTAASADATAATANANAGASSPGTGTSASASSSASAGASAGASLHLKLPLRLQFRIRRVANAVGQRLGWRKEALLLQNHRPWMPFRVTTALRHAAFW